MRQRSFISLLFLIGMIAASAFRVGGLVSPPGEIDPDRWGLHDFRDAIYYPCLAFVNGDNPYDADAYRKVYPAGQLFPLYSPLTLLMHCPLTVFPFDVARWVYFGITIVLTLLLTAIALQLARSSWNWGDLFLFGGILLMTRPGHMNLALGQSTLQAVILSLGALAAARRSPLLSGFCLAAATFKPTYGVLLFCYMLAQKHWRAIGWSILLGLLMTLPPLLWLTYNAGGPAEMLESMSSNRVTFDEHPNRNPLTSYTRLDLPFLFSKWTGVVITGRSEIAVAFLCAAAIGVLISWKQRSRQIEFGADFATVFLILLTMLVSIYHHAYDWLLVATPLFAVLFSSRPEVNLGMSARTRFAIGALLMLPAVNFLATKTVMGWLSNYPTAWGVITSANAAALGVAWLVTIWTYISWQPTTTLNESS